jgi:endo-1,4-beta-xylanase
VCGQVVASGAGAGRAPDEAGRRVATAPGPRPDPTARPLLGAAVSWERLRVPGAYQRLFLAHFSGLTPETELKMDALAPFQGVVDFARPDALVRWARARGIRVHGHTLLWHRQEPRWVAEGVWTRAELLGVLRWYVRTVVGHFRGRIPSWDVVNEPMAEDGSLRPTVWQRVIGDDYIAHALRYAREADPDARLMLNEFNVERPGPKADGFARLIAGLRRDGAPLDAVGLQSHLRSTWAPSRAELEDTMRRYAQLGVGVDVTELDVEIGPGPGELRRQAEIYRRVAGACLALPACSRLTTWGFTDASTWLGGEARPLPFDAGGRPKPAWGALLAGLGRGT